MLIFPTQQLAENHFANGLRLVTTAKDFFKDLDRAFKNWSEGVCIEEVERDRQEIINSYNK
jgi:hypothetical protein